MMSYGQYNLCNDVLKLSWTHCAGLEHRNEIILNHLHIWVCVNFCGVKSEKKILGTFITITKIATSDSFDIVCSSLFAGNQTMQISFCVTL